MKNTCLGRALALAILLLALSAVMVSGCSAGGSYDDKTASTGLPQMNPERADQVSADLTMRVPNVQKSETDIGRILRTANGYVESASSSDLASRYPTMTMILKIPVSNVAAALDSLESLGIPTAKTISMQDVTDASPGASAGSAKPLLSTVNLSLEQSVAAITQDPEWLVQAWEEASLSAIVVYRTLFVGLIWLLAFLPIWFPGVFLYWKYGRRPKQRTIST